jgi:RpiB/LacA/LacB family sugar-phosphate isomerase
MRIAVGADHAGYALKRIAMDELKRLNHDVLDLGTDSEEPVDYPDFSQAVAEMVMESTADRGLLICGSGVGASVAANKIPGVRAAVCHDTYSARQGVEHDDMNVLCLGARVVGVELALELIRAWAGAHFSGAQRYARRLAKLQAIETQYQRSAARD